MRLKTIFSLISVLILAACSAGPTPSPSATPSPTPLPGATHTPAPTSTATPQPSATATASPTASPTATRLAPVQLGTPAVVPAAAISAASAGLVRELARWGRGQVEDLQWSPDGRQILVQTAGRAYIFNTTNTSVPDLNASPDENEGLLTYYESQDWVMARPDGQVQFKRAKSCCFAFTIKGTHPQVSADGDLLAVIDGETARIYKTADNMSVGAFEQPGLERMAFSPDGTQAVTLSRTQVTAWKIAAGSKVFAADYGRVLRVQFTADGSLLLVQNRSQANESGIDVYRAVDGTLLSTIKTGGSFSLAPDGQRLYVFSNYPAAGQIQTFSLPDGKLAGDLRAGGSIYRLAVSPDGTTLAVSVPDPIAGALVLYDAAGRLIHRLTCEYSCDAALPLFSPDGRLVAMPGQIPTTGFKVSTVAVYEIPTGKLVALLRSPKNLAGQVEQMAFSPDSKTLLTYTQGVENAVYAWQVPALKPVASLDWAAYLLSLGSLSPDGGLAAVADASPATRILSVADGSQSYQLAGSSQPQFSPQGDLLLTSDFRSGRFDALRLWKADGTQKLLTFAPEILPPLAFVPGQDLVAGVHGSTVRLMKLPGGQLLPNSLVVTDKPGARLLLVQISLDGSLAAAGDGDGQVWVWRMSDRRQIYSLAGQGKASVGLVFTPDGQTLLSGASDGLVKVWNMADGSLVRTIHANELVSQASAAGDQSFGLLGGLSLAPDGQVLALSGVQNPLQLFPNRSGAVLLVQVADGSLLRILRGGGGTVQFSPDGLRLLASGDGVVHVFGVAP